MERKQRIAEAAIRILAREGARGLTHRAVDAEAGIPPGSTSNSYRTREALLDALGAHLAELDRITIEDIATQAPDNFPLTLAHFAANSASAHSAAARARYILLLDPHTQGEGGAAFRAHREYFRDWGIRVLTPHLGERAEWGATQILALLDGIIMTSATSGIPVDIQGLADTIEAIAPRVPGPLA